MLGEPEEGAWRPWKNKKEKEETQNENQGAQTLAIPNTGVPE